MKIEQPSVSINGMPESYEELVGRIGATLFDGREQALREVNSALVVTNWKIGRHIVEFEQQGKERAQYGDGLLDRLSRDLTARYGKGFSRSNIVYMRRFFILFPKK